MRTLGRAFVALVSVGALTVTAGAAHAESWSHADPTGDMVQQIYHEDEEDGEFPFHKPAPDRARGDISSTRAAHNLTRLGIKFTMRDALREYEIHYWIYTPSGSFLLTRKWRGSSGGPAQVAMYEPGPPRRCHGLDWTIHWDKATVAVSIPRRCLGDPRWVRIGVNVVSNDPGAHYLDDAIRTGSGECPDCVLERVVYSPRIYRG